jgi:3-oxoadipate enol-lactonase
VPRLPVHGAEIYYEVAGSGPPILFAHGLGGNHMSWWQQVPFFSSRWTCVTFAHRGFFPSTGTADPDVFADDLSALIEHLDLKNVTLIAQSMGGWTCLDYMLRDVSRVRALVMAETTGSLRRPAADVAHANVRASALFARGIYPAAGERMAMEQPALHHLYRLIDRLSDGLDKSALHAALVAAMKIDPPRLAGAATPILWLFGTESYLAPESAAWVEATFPEARLVRVPDAGHSIYFERPDRFNREVADFLDAVSARST